jgi:phosphate-selective porin OprO/OprP
MKHAIKMTALAVFAASFGATALAADKASSTGGFKIKSEDGNFEAKIGGRIHFDGNYYTDEDDINVGTQNSGNDFFFRRARLTLEGRAYDYKYKFENDFASSGGQSTIKNNKQVNNEGLREMWIGRDVLGGANLRLGQAKPYRGMEELTSSNELTFMERPFATATGIYGEQFVLGAFLDGHGEGYGWGVSAYSPRSASDANAGGNGANARGFIVPIRSNGNLVHIGLSASVDKYGIGNEKNPDVRVVGRENGLKSGKLLAASYDEQTTVAAELAARFGAVTLQGEYAKSAFKDTITAVPNPDQDVDTYYVQASYMLTDHVKPYDFKKGVFKSPKVDGEEGALELKARFDTIENKDISGNEASYYTVGLNYYATPNTRFMLEYVDGETKVGTDKKASAVTARAQFNF